MSEAATIEAPAIDPAIAEVIEEAKTGFDLKSRLLGRSLRESTVTLFLDEATGAELGEPKVEGIEILGSVIREHVPGTGILGQISDLGEIVEDETDDVKAERERLDGLKAALIAKLESTALVIKLRAVPPVIVESARRLARADLSIKGKGIPAELEEEFSRLHNAHLLASAIVSITDRVSNETQTTIAVADAEALTSYLPASEYMKLNTALTDTLFKDAVSASVVSDPSFSQAG